MKDLGHTKIGFVGRSGSGKTTLANYLVKEYGFVKLSFADKLKQEAAKIFGKDVYCNKEKYREFLQFLGSFVRRKIDIDFWIRHVHSKLYDLESKGVKNIVVDDVRYLNEAKFLKDHGFILVRVVGRSANLGHLAGHESETEQDEIVVDYIVDNSGELSETVRSLINQIYNKDNRRWNQ